MEDNKLIAEFMGLRRGDMPDNKYLFPFGKHRGYCRAEKLKFHASWDWLMPVVEKIVELDITPAPNWSGYMVEIVPRGYVKIEGFPMKTILTNVSIEGGLLNAVYKAVVQFIQYYNTL